MQLKYSVLQYAAMKLVNLRHRTGRSILGLKTPTSEDQYRQQRSSACCLMSAAVSDALDLYTCHEANVCLVPVP